LPGQARSRFPAWVAESTGFTHNPINILLCFMRVPSGSRALVDHIPGANVVKVALVAMAFPRF
jgi:hypothetical protein